ncbi:MAG: glycosyltransferase family 39 protein [Nocardioides sp.]|nr:glycosyltransferase family 39 protein [Nocardioides sp.]
MTALHAPFATDVSAAAPDVRPRRLTLERASLLLLLALTAVAYLWTLSESGYANDFYAAAAQAGSKSWEAWFFGSLDAGNAITVDKPPAALWVMGLSVRIFGLSSWSILVPEALMGVATVGLVFALVRRVSTWQAGIAAGALTALTPAAALMFRFDNPDALLLLLLVGAGYATLRATEKASPRLLALAGVLVGFAFLTKMLQGFLVIPVFVLVYLLAAPPTLKKRLLHVGLSALAVLVSAGWYVAIFELVPASARPYMDGSTKNSMLELVFGYNGFGRITGSESGGHGNFGSSAVAGPLRMFEGVSGGMVAWLAPAALILLVAGLVLLWKRPRTDLSRAALILTAGSMLITGAVFSMAQGIYHDYYTVALAPWIAMAAVIGTVIVWRRRSLLAARVVLAVAVLATAVWSFVLLGQSGEQPYATLRWVVLVLGILAALALAVVDRLARPLALGLIAAVAVIAGLGPASYAVQTIATPHSGSIVTAGPYQSGFGPGGGHGGPGGFGGPAGDGGFRGFGGQAARGQAGQAGAFAGGKGGFGGGQGGFPAMAGNRTGDQTAGAAGGPGGGMGGMMGGATVSSQVTKALQSNAGEYRWVLATGGSESAASYELASGESVMAIGGFNSNAPSITLKQFQTYVKDGKIHYYAAGGRGFGGGDRAGGFPGFAGGQTGQETGQGAAQGGFPGFAGGAQTGRGGFAGGAGAMRGGPGGEGGMGGFGATDPDNNSSKIESWVEKNFTKVTIDGSTFYDLTKPLTSTNGASS